MSDTPRTDAFKAKWPWGRRQNWPCSFESESFVCIEQLERELAEANHLRERAESSLSGAAARMRAAQGEAETWEKRYNEMIIAPADLKRSAKLANPLHEVLDKMDLIGGSFVRSLAACFCNADPENQQKLMTAFRPILERYDSMIPTTHPETP